MDRKAQPSVDHLTPDEALQRRANAQGRVYGAGCGSGRRGWAGLDSNQGPWGYEPPALTG